MDRTNGGMRDVVGTTLLARRVAEGGEMAAARAVDVVQPALRDVAQFERLRDELGRVDTALQCRIYPV